MKIDLPENMTMIINALEEHGHEAYAVGGCVRDALLGRIPKDWDIATSATPQEVKQVFRRCIDTGIEHGTVTVLIKDEPFEVTTYRIDGEYEDHRHPTEVTYTKNIIEDLKRRDFTINAMAYHPEKGIVDAFEGIADLNNGLIRCVGKATERFEEDALRIMRAVRFSAELNYKIEVKTEEAIRLLKDTLQNISVERIQVELLKILLSDHPAFVRKLYEYGITDVILPEFNACMDVEQNNPFHAYSVGEHTLKALENSEANKYVRLAVLFHDFGKVQTKTTDSKGIDHFTGHATVSERFAKNYLRKMHFDNETIKKVSKIIKYHTYALDETEYDVRVALSQIGKEDFSLLLAHYYADIMAKNPAIIEKELKKLAHIKQIYEKIMNENQCVTISELAVDGNDLTRIGFKQGKAIGEALKFLLEKVLEDQRFNTKERLLKLASDQFQQHE